MRRGILTINREIGGNILRVTIEIIFLFLEITAFIWHAVDKKDENILISN
jgi:hypothetical protein